MKTHRFTAHEIDTLCCLYLEGKLDIKEEHDLRLLLSNSSDLSEDARQTLSLMKLESAIVNSATSHRKGKNFGRWFSGIAAAAIIAILSIGHFLNTSPSTPDEDIYIVWRDGRKITGNEAKLIVEEQERLDMQMFRRIIRLQREQMMGTLAYVDFSEFE